MRSVLCLLLPLCLCGCSFIPHKTVALEQSRIITALGIDITESGYRLICYEGSDLSEESKPDPKRLFQVEGSGLSEALNTLRATSHRRPVLDYAGVILLGEELLHSKAKQVLSELYDNPDFPYGSPVILASPSAQSVLKTMAEKTADLSGSIDAMLQSSNRLSLPQALSLPEFYNALLAPDQDPYLPGLAENDGKVSLSEIGVFKGGALASVLTKDAAKGLGVLLGAVRDYPLMIDDTSVYLRRVKITSKDRQLRLKLYCDADIGQSTQTLTELTEKRVGGWVNATVKALEKVNPSVLKYPLPDSVKITCRMKALTS